MERANYLPQLDSLRTLAVFLVFLAHWSNWTDASGLPLGAMGVTLFFVLSGFLISRILLEQRRAAAEVGRPRLYVFRQFFIRRALRIFPIYYLTLLVLMLLPTTPPDFHENVWYYAAYLANFRFAYTDAHFGRHLWSLSVEEQFYLFWPFVMLFVRVTWLPIVLVGAGVAGVLSRISLPGPLMPCSLDSFALGAGLSYCWVHKPKWELTYLKLASLTTVGLVAWGLKTSVPPWGLLISCASVVLIGLAGRGFRGPVGRVLELPQLVYLGRISYGLYLFHEFVRFNYWQLHVAVVQRDLRWPVTGWILVPSFGYPVKFWIFVALTVLLAAVSWRFVEKPINDLRHRISYV